MKFRLAQVTLIAVMAWRGVFAQGVKEPSVGERLAADLTWSQAERDDRFGHMDRVFPVHEVRRGGKVLVLPSRPVVGLDGLLANYMKSEHLAGVLVLRDGRVLAERYGLGADSSTLWTSFSMTKALTDTLAGAALRSGALRSLDDDVTRYLPEMKGSAYEGVSVRQLMTMTSGVGWNENYTSADADNVRIYGGDNTAITYMRGLKRVAAPGSVWHYSTGETDLLGVLLRRATGRSLAEQLSGAVWMKAGMERDATWIATAAGPEGEEFGGSGVSATLRDYGRLGLWVLRGGGDSVPKGWFAEATKSQVTAGGAAYGYGWWPQADGSFAALGIFGQSLLIDPKRKLVVVSLGDWPEATGASHSKARVAFWGEVQAVVDANLKARAVR